MATADLPTAPAAVGEHWDDEPLYEIIDCQRVQLPPMGIFAKRLSTMLATRLELYGLEANRGQAVMEGLFRLALPVDRNRRPDTAYVSSQRWPSHQPLPERDNAWDVVPDLAVEIVSPTDLVEELMTKVDEYFRAGVRMVWVIYPHLRLVQVYESLTQCRGLLRSDTLDGGSVLPGFRLPLAELFPPPVA